MQKIVLKMVPKRNFLSVCINIAFFPFTSFHWPFRGMGDTIGAHWFCCIPANLPKPDSVEGLCPQYLKKSYVTYCTEIP